MLPLLTDRVSLWSKTTTTGSYGHDSTGYAIQADNVAARIEEQSGTEAPTYGSDRTRYRVRVFLSRDALALGIKEDWQIRRGSERFDIQVLNRVSHPFMQKQYSHVECDCERITDTE